MAEKDDSEILTKVSRGWLIRFDLNLFFLYDITLSFWACISAVMAWS